ncbi:FAD-binding oxidoreductase [Nonomuraea sp. NPDC000554]|uniref:NAD(P)/FAD-dependent oxidoreductase n=1 Tax=Nonomuraea sp. NPDC000554 TaxID=3154259 RepID=UPI0033268D3E
MPDVLIVGAGVVGASVAYHLAELGCTDVVVMDRRAADAHPGSTGLAPGFVGQLSSTPELAALAQDSVKTFSTLHDSTGTAAFRRVGCLEIATGGERLTSFHADVEQGKRLGIDARVIAPQEAAGLAPGLVDPSQALGALYVPSDGAAEPTVVTTALVESAAARGVAFRWGTAVHELALAGGRVVGVVTDAGVVRAERVVLATGIWGTRLTEPAGQRLPMVAVEHPYVLSPERPELADALEPTTRPIVRYPEHAVYTRQHGRRWGLGSYAHQARPVAALALGDSAERLYPHQDFDPVVTTAAALVPAWRGTSPERRINGVFALTPDELPLVGTPAALPGLYLAEASWVTHSGGVGRLVAHLLTGKGEPPVDPDRLHPDRFAGWTQAEISSRALAHYSNIYDAH